MKAAALIPSLIVLLAALPAHARDGGDVSGWSLEKLCEKKDKSRYSEAVFAEIERRGVFTFVDLALIRWDEVEVGMDEAALRCSWGAPVHVSRGDDAVSQTYRKRIDGYWRTLDVSVIAERVATARILPIEWYAGYTDPWTTFSGKDITSSGLIGTGACPGSSTFC